jgi:hypothetical protein
MVSSRGRLKVKFEHFCVSDSGYLCFQSPGDAEMVSINQLTQSSVLGSVTVTVIVIVS